MTRATILVAVAAFCLSCLTQVEAETTVFFQGCENYTLLDWRVTSDTISSKGYIFTYTRDKLFAGGTGQPIGRPVRVSWPDGIEA